LARASDSAAPPPAWEVVTEAGVVVSLRLGVLEIKAGDYAFVEYALVGEADKLGVARVIKFEDNDAVEAIVKWYVLPGEWSTKRAKTHYDNEAWEAADEPEGRVGIESPRASRASGLRSASTRSRARPTVTLSSARSPSVPGGRKG